MDTLTCNGIEKSFKAWGLSLSRTKCVKQSGGADTFTVTIPNRSIAAEVDNPTFPFESKIIVRTNRNADFTGGTIKFVGYCVSAPAQAVGAHQSVTYEFKGPWYHLENCDYMQSYLGDNDIFYFLPETIFNTSTAGTIGWAQISVGDQIQDVLQWLLKQYSQQAMDAPFQYKGRALNNAGAPSFTTGNIDLSQNATIGAPGGDFGFNGKKYNYLLAAAGLSIDRTLFSLFLPTFIEKPMKCSRAISKCLELSPRINIWFDYSTTDDSGAPLPTIRFDLIDTAPPVSLPVFTGNVPAGPSHKELNITPWQQLAPRAVIIKYRITNTTNGQKTTDYKVDKWSASGSNVNLDGTGNNALDPNCGLRVVNEIIDLEGFNQTSLEGHLDVEPVLAGGANQEIRRDWWASKRGGEVSELEDTRIRFQDPIGAVLPDYTEIPDPVITNATTGEVMSNATLIAAGLCDRNGNLVLNRLVRGTYHAWMNRRDGQAVVTMKVKISAKMSYSQYDCVSASTNVDPTYIADIDQAGNLLHFFNAVDHSVNIEVTNASPDDGVSGFASFFTNASSQVGEGYIVGPGGIAQYLYQHLQAPQYSGEDVMVGAEFANTVTLGNALNLTGGAAQWTNMNAQIQQLTEDWGAKEITIRIGPSKNLSAGQLSQLFNMWRYRRPWYNPDLRTDNAAAGTDEVDMAKSHGDANTTTGVSDSGQQAHTLYETSPDGSTPGVIAGQINHAPNLIKTILDATTPTPVAPFADPDLKKMQPRECQFCDEAGNVVNAILHATGFYTKP